MFIVSQGILADAKKLAEKLADNSQTRGELEFSPGHPLTVTTNPEEVGEMVSFTVKGVRFYLGFRAHDSRAD